MMNHDDERQIRSQLSANYQYSHITQNSFFTLDKNFENRTSISVVPFVVVKQCSMQESGVLLFLVVC